MYTQKVLRIFRETDALRTGHFVYKSGWHGTEYVDKREVLMHPIITSNLCFKIAYEFQNANVETVIAPAVGAIGMSQSVAEHLTRILKREVLDTYAEKENCAIPDPEGKGRHCFYNTGRFTIAQSFKRKIIGHNVLVVEDVLNTGSSVRALVEAVREIGGNVVGVGAICNRGNVTTAMLNNIPKLFALANFHLKTFTAEECMQFGPCSEHVPINTTFGHGREFLAQKQKTLSP